MANVGAFLKAAIVSFLFVYSTAKVVHIRSKSVGILNRFVQLVIFCYIIIYAVVIAKGYQKVELGIPSTISKVKGVTRTNLSDPRVGNRIWDAVDLVQPAQENSAFFVTTNVIVTNNQQQSECPESPGVANASCKADRDCPEGTPYELGHGVATGKCNDTTHTCQVEAWCPIEHDSLATNYSVLTGTERFTVLLKSHVYFPSFNIRRSNIIASSDAKYLTKCTYNAETDPFCPIFRLGDIISNTSPSVSAKQAYEDIAYKGGVVGIRIKWRCNFDYSSDLCKPEYTFTRIDDSHDNLVAGGFNFRYANNYFNEQGVEMRQLVKAYGVLYIITVDAKGYKFDLRTIITTIGSGVALLATATIISDVIVLYVHKYRDVFKESKYESVDPDLGFTPLAPRSKTEYDTVT